MKRFRVFQFDFDARVHVLKRDIPDDCHERVRGLHQQNREKIERGLLFEFGELAAEQKRQNFIDLGPKPISILAFHNRFLEQIHVAFVMGAYYPALTGACALGERVLNHLVLTLREEFKSTPGYEEVSKHKAFSNWALAIKTLAAWDVLLPDVVAEFGKLYDLRNKAIHFNPETDRNDRALALDAIKNLKAIVGNQFCAIGSQPWFITDVPGECYIKKDWEERPFIRKVYLPNCTPVGPRHSVESVLMTWTIKDDNAYEDRKLTDEEFCTLRLAARAEQLAEHERVFGKPTTRNDHATER